MPMRVNNIYISLILILKYYFKNEQYFNNILILKLSHNTDLMSIAALKYY